MWRALKAAFRAIAASFNFVLKGVWEGGKLAYRLVREPVVAVATMVGSVGTAIDHVVQGAAKTVGGVVRGLFGVKPPTPQAGETANKAVAKVSEAKAAVTAAAADADVVADFRRLARAVGRGKTPAPSTLERLPKPLADYLMGLSEAEARVLGQLPCEILQATLSGQRLQEGVRSPVDIAKTARARVVASNDEPEPGEDDRAEYKGYPRRAA